MSTLNKQRQAKSQFMLFMYEAPKRIAVFCPNGCEFSMVASEHDSPSCPQCEAAMSVDAEDAYMDSLVAAGNVQ